jgi:hypothetical protein
VLDRLGDCGTEQGGADQEYQPEFIDAHRQRPVSLYTRYQQHCPQLKMAVDMSVD